jgi:hypothetical protein
MSDLNLIDNCAPTLAGIKTGNLFLYDCKDFDSFEKEITEYNKYFEEKGIKIEIVNRMNNKILLYVFRPDLLKRDLMCSESKELLKRFGYDRYDFEDCIIRLKERLSSMKAVNDFPHEIGIFLGYPVEDVRGFIDNKAKGYKCVGYWKVYGDINEAKKRFNLFDKCTSIYKERYKSGVSLDILAVKKLCKYKK